MAADNDLLHPSYAGWPPAGPLDEARTAWPFCAETWLGSTIYPAGRGAQQPVIGWSCPGCGRGYAPAVRQCPYCPDAKPEAVLHPCPKPREGGLCGCDEP